MIGGARLVTTEPAISEIAGRYTLSYVRFGRDVDAEVYLKAKDAYIELSTNDGVVLHNIPIVPESRSSVFAIEEFRSGVGTFEIAALGSTAKSNFYGLYLDVGKFPDPMGHPRFKRKEQALSLSFDYFDGDFTERMVFTRFSR